MAVGLNLSIGSLGGPLTEDEAAALWDDETEDVELDTLRGNQGSSGQERELENQQKEITTTEVLNSEDLFDEEDAEENDPKNPKKKPESVGSEVHQEQGKSEPRKEEDSPENENPYSAFFEALRGDGAFPDLKDEDIAEVKDAESFRAMFDKQVAAQADEMVRRVNEALNLGVEPSEIQKNEGYIKYLDSITEEALVAETPEGENLRKRIIQQAFINRGYSPERAVKQTERIFSSAEDLDEAKVALQENKDYFLNHYQDLLAKAKEEDDREREALRAQTERIRKSMLSEEAILGGLQVDKKTRQAAFDSVHKPVYKDPKTGQLLTKLQKYQQEHPEEYIKNFALIFELTNGFTSVEKMVKPQVEQKTKSKLRELEHTLKNPGRSSRGESRLITAGSSKEAQDEWIPDIGIG